ncbi:MAG: MMPL family transporter [Clostridiales bacterium]|nr:MMPL family transporter [Clostridiales bacterium]
MANRFASFVVSHRKGILIIYLLLAVASIFTLGRVNINYDIVTYLSRDTLTRSSLELMNSEFGHTEIITMLFPDIGEEKAFELKDWFSGMDGVIYSSFDPEADVKSDGERTYYRVSVYSDADDSFAFTETLQNSLRGQSDIGGGWLLTGDAAQTIYVENRIAEEIPLAMGIAVIVVVAVLFLTGRSYIEPAIFFIVIAVSILINMGTNFVFPSISFISFAVCAILQLALAMDYSIMLLRAFCDIRDAGADEISAMKLALRRSLMPISSSSLTTVAGLGSLMFMSFTIGFDIGMVLSKGILISMVSVFTLMPALILMFAKPLRKTAHRPIPLGGELLGRFARSKASRFVLVPLLILVIAGAAALQGSIQYSFMDGNLSQNQAKLFELYGRNNSVVLLLPGDDSDESFAKQRALIDEVRSLRYQGRDIIKSVHSFVTTAEAAVKYYTPKEIASMLNLPSMIVQGYYTVSGFGSSTRGDKLIAAAHRLLPGNPQVGELSSQVELARRIFLSDRYSRVILEVDMPSFGDEAMAVTRRLIDLTRSAYPEGAGVTGLIVSAYDISEAFGGDLMRVNLITILAIFLIVAISFKSATVPVMLICVIQGAVWINTALSVPAGIPIFFMCYLICLALQMGATIDYGILLTSNYIRQRGIEDKPAAVTSALKLSLPTIFTSGLILFAAGLAIGLTCSVYYISRIGLLIASGAFFSLALIVFLLPPLLIALDRLIVRTRRKGKKP